MRVQFSSYGVLFSSHGVLILTLWGPILILWGPILISCVHPQEDEEGVTLWVDS